MNINELVKREFQIEEPDEGSDHILKEILVQSGQSVSPGDKVCIVEYKKGESIYTITLEFDIEIYGDVTVCDILAQIGQKLNETISLYSYEVEKSFANIIEMLIYNLVEDIDNLYKAPWIPEKKLNNAIEKYAEKVDPERVVFLYDDTVFGSAKDGFIITDSALYYHHMEDNYGIRFRNIKSFKNSRKYKNKKRFLIIETDDDVIKIPHDTRMLDWSEMDSFFETVMEIKKEGILKDVDEWVIVQDMSDEVNLSYVQAIIWMVYDDDAAIDKKELAGIQMLMTQLEFTAELRYTVRLNISEPTDLDIEGIINKMFQEIPTGSENSVSISLIKDMVNVFHKIHDIQALESPQIVRVCKLLEIDADQLSLICQAVDFDKQLLDGSISLSETRKLATDLAGKAAAVGVPIGAVYLSGSVLGLSAAGITSGLSALGLGGYSGCHPWSVEWGWLFFLVSVFIRVFNG